MSMVIFYVANCECHYQRVSSPSWGPHPVRSTDVSTMPRSVSPPCCRRCAQVGTGSALAKRHWWHWWLNSRIIHQIKMCIIFDNPRLYLLQDYYWLLLYYVIYTYSCIIISSFVWSNWRIFLIWELLYQKLLPRGWRYKYIHVQIDK